MKKSRWLQLLVVGSLLCIGSVALLDACKGDANDEPPLEGVSEATRNKTRVIYVKVPDGDGKTEDRVGESEGWEDETQLGNVFSFEYRNRFQVNGDLLATRIAAAVATLTEDGYRVNAVIPITRGYSRVSNHNSKDGGGWGYGVSPTDGVLIVGIR